MNFTITEKLPYESIRDYAYRVLSKNIINLQLVPGTALSEQDIAGLLNISRTPVREAFIRLAQENLLDILPQKGTYIAKINLDQVAESRFLRVTMEQAIMKIACEAFSQEALAQLRENLALQERCVKQEDYLRFFELDGMMHGLIFKTCGKARIWQMIEQMSMNYNRVRMMSIRAGYCEELPKLFLQHQQIVQLIEAGDAVLGEVVIGEHINKLIADVEKLQELHGVFFQ